MASESTLPPGSQHPRTTSENTQPRRAGTQPTPLPADYAEFLDAYTTVRADVRLAALVAAKGITNDVIANTRRGGHARY